MSGENFNKKVNKLRVLLAPLDWGLGHATRCIPLVKELLFNNCEVIIAGDGAVETLLKAEFPYLVILPLAGYKIQYSRKQKYLGWKIFRQLPQILRMINYEKHWLKNVLKQYQIDLVISDNRPGLHTKLVPAVYITHQLKIKARNRLSAWIAQQMHYRFIKRFTVCWVPDAAGSENLAGELSHPGKMPAIPVRYIGALSRFEKEVETARQNDLLILLSGPEPQRSILEEKLLKQLEEYNGTAVVLRGLPGNAELPRHKNVSVQLFNHLPADELNQLIQRTEIVISRSGYTTVMDLVKLEQKALLIPTPGQTEQEYLAGYLMKRKLFYSVNQDGFELSTAVEKMRTFPYVSIKMQEQYKPVIRELVENLISGIAKSCKE